MPNILNIFPPYLILLNLILVIIPTITAITLRRSLYRYLFDSANKVSRLLVEESRGKQPAIVHKLEARFQQASKKLEQVNTIALIDGLYSQERLKFLGISLRCEQWDYFCQALPNLLLAFGLLGTFIGISSNLYNLSQTINLEQNITDISNLVDQLQKPLQNMGIAFSTSLVAILCSSLLIVVNTRCNTNFAKSLLISSLEDYLDNIFKIKVDGYSRLDKAVDRMVKQQEEFLNRFHEKVGQVLESTIGNAANKMVAANQGFQNNVDSMVSRFNDISSSMAVSTNSFQESAFSLKEQTQTVTKIVPQFEAATKNIKSGSNLYLLGAKKIEASKFSENLERLTADLASTQKQFSQSTAFLGNQVEKISDSHQQVTNLAQQVYTNLQTASDKLQDSSIKFIEAAQTFQESDFADKLSTATRELTIIPQQFNDSTAILHQSTNVLSTAIDKIDTSAEKTNNLIAQVTNLNQHSTKLLEINTNKTEQEIQIFNNIQSELNNIVTTLEIHQEKINISMTKFGEKVLTSFEQGTSSNIKELQNLTTEIEHNKNSLLKNQTEIGNLVNCLNQQGKQFNSSLNETCLLSDRLISSFEQSSQNNVQEISKLTTEFQQIITQLNELPKEINELNIATLQQSKQVDSQFNKSINSANKKIKNTTKKTNNLL